MRSLLRLALLIGLVGASLPWWPSAWRIWPLTELPVGSLAFGGVVVAAFAAGALLLLRALRSRGGGDAGDGEVRARLAGLGFAFTQLSRGWQAEGRVRGVPVIVRRVSDVHATRFGRPWTLLVTLPGRPGPAWPFNPDEGGIVARDDSSFTVVVADVALAGRSRELETRLLALVAARESR